uniref:Uncharacterized protein n=1 Tax=Rhizophora mucronata TaxID=61149 RepID=A0A2P2Q524_RHIMU
MARNHQCSQCIYHMQLRSDILIQECNSVSLKLLLAASKFFGNIGGGSFLYSCNYKHTPS